MSLMDAKRKAQPKHRRKPFKSMSFQLSAILRRSTLLKRSMNGRRIIDAKRTLKNAMVKASSGREFTMTPFDPQIMAAEEIASTPRDLESLRISASDNF